MEGIINILAADRIDTADALVAEIKSFSYLILRNFPVSAILRKTLQYFLRERSSVYVKLMQYHCTFSCHPSFLSQNLHKLAVRERGILIPLTNS
jgi:hypothetical protein